MDTFSIAHERELIYFIIPLCVQYLYILKIHMVDSKWLVSEKIVNCQYATILKGFHTPWDLSISYTFFFIPMDEDLTQAISSCKLLSVPASSSVV